MICFTGEEDQGYLPHYEHVNLDMTQRCLIAECWCPVEDLDVIQQALMKGTVSSWTCDGHVTVM